MGRPRPRRPPSVRLDHCLSGAQLGLVGTPSAPNALSRPEVFRQFDAAKICHATRTEKSRSSNRRRHSSKSPSNLVHISNAHAFREAHRNSGLEKILSRGNSSASSQFERWKEHRQIPGAKQKESDAMTKIFKSRGFSVFVVGFDQSATPSAAPEWMKRFQPLSFSSNLLPPIATRVPAEYPSTFITPRDSNPQSLLRLPPTHPMPCKAVPSL